MKAFFLGMFVCFFLFMMLFMYLNKVGKDPRHDATGENELYTEWEEKTRARAVVPSEEQLEAWTTKVREAFTPFEAERAAENFPKAYDEDFYFRDAFHLYTDLQEMTDYMVKTAEASPGVTFTFRPAIQNGIDIILPWTMILPSKDGGDAQKSLGVSHLRFSPEGKVIFHQDYWDSADVLVKRVPIANGIIELVRRQF